MPTMPKKSAPQPRHTMSQGDMGRISDAIMSLEEALHAPSDSTLYYKLANAVERLQLVQKNIVFKNLA